MIRPILTPTSKKYKLTTEITEYTEVIFYNRWMRTYSNDGRTNR
jgi:hypothetical protein